MDKTILGVDWGTSNRRAYLIDQQGQCVAEYEDDQGMLAVGGRERFGASLDALRSAMGIAASVPTIMSGMVGSASGWQEVNYLDASVPLTELPAHLAAVLESPWSANSRIVPGYAYRHGASVDVMRGEETQLLGAVALGQRDGWLVLPGTHSKWVLLEDGAIASFATYMTGELFAMLSKGGTLSSMMGGSGNDAADATGFAAGLDQAKLGEPLSNSLFRVRAGVVSRSAPADQAAAFVSGLLIGAEFAAAAGSLPAGGTVTVIGSPALAKRYAAAAQHFGLQCQVLDPHRVYCTAISQFIKG
ncbi:MAG: 2-dehydro-3-deoxygalactonokinase [Duganella sp.]